MKYITRNFKKHSVDNYGYLKNNLILPMFQVVCIHYHRWTSHEKQAQVIILQQTCKQIPDPDGRIPFPN
jgi:hypothetical protein